MEDLERICDECEKHSSLCKWPKMKARLVCVRFTEKHIKCKIEGVPVSNHAPWKVGSSKRQRLTTLEVLESASDTAEVSARAGMSKRKVHA